MRVRLENTSGNHYKFYVLEIQGSDGQYECVANWGRIGTRGRSQVKASGTMDACYRELLSIMRYRRHSRGYDVVDGDDEFRRLHPGFFPRAAPAVVREAMATPVATPVRGQLSRLDQVRALLNDAAQSLGVSSAFQEDASLLPVLADTPLGREYLTLIGAHEPTPATRRRRQPADPASSTLGDLGPVVRRRRVS